MNTYTLTGTIRTIRVAEGKFSVEVQAPDFAAAADALDPHAATQAAVYETDSSDTTTVLRNINLDDVNTETAESSRETITFEVQDTVLAPIYSEIQQDEEGNLYSPVGVERVNAPAVL